MPAYPHFIEISVIPGLDGCRLLVDGIEVRSGLTSDNAASARNEARRLVMCAAHDALGQLAACLAMAGRVQ